MKKTRVLVALSIAAAGIFIAAPAYAEPTTKAECDATNGYTWHIEDDKCVEDPCAGNLIQLDCVNQEPDEQGGGIFDVLNIALDVLTVGIGIAATAGVIFAALRYTQARDNAENAAGAKKMIINIIIGLAVWAVFYALLQWLIPPGGLIFK